MAPEYAMHRQFLVKSDVFNFVVLAWKYWREGAGSSLIDPASRAHSGSTCDIVRCIHIRL
ncbi:hypothetical protein RJ639_029486 [Escallonia herrerae]|uniref:Uncharacterized protein n=1 Tax=Escallonia herrerae TaxID=1293975 RepID=A0AA88USS7_9ASTE|nr:hypothetical protein RJ639_029486 [Escallonia herrerae]